MLILDVGKIKYNKKFYKAIIYTTLVLNILSYGIFPKSQSKYKEEVDNEVVYTAKLYTEEKRIITTDKDIEITDIKLVEDDYRYVPDAQNAFFEYSIPDAEGKLDFANINSNIKFTVTNTNGIVNGSCSVVKQVQRDSKGIVWCTGSSLASGVTLTINAKDTYVDSSPSKIETVNVTIKGTATYTRRAYDEIVEAVSPKILALNSPGDCTNFDKMLEEYDAYYAENALYWYNKDTGENSTASFSEIDAIKKYVAMYGVDSSSCNLANLDIPGISSVKVVTDVTNTLKRYVYTIEDNFVGYAKTYTQDAGSKEMYFTTSDGYSFVDETDSSKWQNIFIEYLKKFYSTENPEDIAEYVDILSVLQNPVIESEIPNGVLHTFKDGKVVIEPSLLDYIYNSKHKEEGKLRVTVLNNGSLDRDEIKEQKNKMYLTFIDNLDVVYGDSYDANTLISLWTTGTNANSEQSNLISDYITRYSLPENGMYIDGLLDYREGYFSSLYNFSVYIYSDGTYNWFEILPLGRIYDGYVLHALNLNMSEDQNKQEEYLRRIERLNKYYGIDKPASTEESITYMRDADGNITGYVRIQHLNGNINNVRYIAYEGGDPSTYPEETTTSNSNTEITTDKIDDEIDTTNGVGSGDSVDIMDDTELKDSASADSNLSGEDKEGKQDNLVDNNEVFEDVDDKMDNDDVSPEIPLDDSDATSINPTVSNSSSVQDAGTSSVPSPSTNNSIESINEIQIEVPPVNTQ